MCKYITNNYTVTMRHDNIDYFNVSTSLRNLYNQPHRLVITVSIKCLCLVINTSSASAQTAR